jgi:chaperonin GroEL (HSP60 family)
MKNKFSLFEQLEDNIKTIEEIDNSVKITLGPTGKNGISFNLLLNAYSLIKLGCIGNSINSLQ